MLPARRQAALRLLLTSRPDAAELCREVEAICHGVSVSSDEYLDIVRRSAFNLSSNRRIGVDVVCRTDPDLAQSTLIGKLERERHARKERFEQMLQEKYDALDEAKFKAIITCRACGSTEVRWEEKQTRSADEGASVFCTCNSCKNRWVMR
jgi:DNA-directed RNA polymerase subunit M/transcription elongation factor TFIIS